MQIFSKILI